MPSICTILLYSGITNKSRSARSRLYEELRRGYESHVLPEDGHDEILQVTLSLNPWQIIGLVSSFLSFN